MVYYKNLTAVCLLEEIIDAASPISGVGQGVEKKYRQPVSNAKLVWATNIRREQMSLMNGRECVNQWKRTA